MFRLITLLLVAAVAAGAAAETFVVTPDGPITIQMAINDCYFFGDVIELTDGVFSGPGNRDLSFFGKDITVRSQSGDPTTCIIDCEGSDQDPHRAFLFENAEGPDAVVEGVHFRLDFSTPGQAVQKAVTSNVSDIFAMGGRPEIPRAPMVKAAQVIGMTLASPLISWILVLPVFFIMVPAE